MQAEGLFVSYAIAGGIAALFYIEPITTFDLDVFIILPDTAGPLISLAPIYSWLNQKNYRSEKEQIVIEGVPVQFIPVFNDLIKDSVLAAVVKKYGQISTRVLRPEHLVAIMLQTARPKDLERLIKFVEQANIETELLEQILTKHQLTDNFKNFKKRFYDR